MKTSLFSSVLLTVALLFPCDMAKAQIVPFRASGSNSVYSPITAETVASGKATNMGLLTASGIAVPSPTPDPLVLDWIALGFEFASANGDRIFVEGGGSVQLIPLGGANFSAIWSGDFTVTGGTGRFANVGPASAPLAVTAVNDPFTLPVGPGDTWTYDWEISGEIDLGNN